MVVDLSAFGRRESSQDRLSETASFILSALLEKWKFLSEIFPSKEVANLDDEMCDGSASSVCWFVPPQCHRLIVKVHNPFEIMDHDGLMMKRSHQAPLARLEACKEPRPSLALTETKSIDLKNWNKKGHKIKEEKYHERSDERTSSNYLSPVQGVTLPLCWWHTLQT